MAYRPGTVINQYEIVGNAFNQGLTRYVLCKCLRCGDEYPVKETHVALALERKCCVVIKRQVGSIVQNWRIVEATFNSRAVKAECVTCGYVKSSSTRGLFAKCPECTRLPLGMYGLWEILTSDIVISKGNVLRHCRCACGVEKYVAEYRLRNGTAAMCRSCAKEEKFKNE